MGDCTEGSNPSFSEGRADMCRLSNYVPLAQLDRALGCGPKGRRFESSRAYIWRDARVVESGGFEIRCAGFRYPGFESLFLR
jgi:hypothetical protein